ncbi:MAG: hypothetical protein JRI72_04925 [Deltaproteobacteria bacterium]|nr:hypothetical protein [Deltaproteobacteria bacterium]
MSKTDKLLEVKTNLEVIRKQAEWSGLKPGFRLLHAGCGPGKITPILYEMIQPAGHILGLDYAEERYRLRHTALWPEIRD